MAERWYAVKLEQIVGAPGFETEEAALGEAVMRVKSDEDPRAVIRVCAEVKRDPEPQVVVTRFED